MTGKTPFESLQATHPSSTTVVSERIELFEHRRRHDTHQPDAEVAAEVQR